jgi:NAD+ synthase (glutamine-hydrolysing)
VAAQAAAFDDELLLVDYADGDFQAGRQAALPGPLESVYRTLVVGVRDYICKNGFPGALLGLSGGIDSALTLAVAVDALGADKVHAVMMPSRYTADISVTDSRDMIGRLGVKYDEIEIWPMYESFMAALAPSFAGLEMDTTEENLQARIRGTLLMALSNKSGKLVLTTGNKSEMTTGYCTLYGDMAGGFAVLKDVAKTLVFELCRWRNTVSDVILERIITRPPSAELRPDQKDQDSLPPYEILDAIMARYVEGNESAADIIAAGYAEADVKRVVRLLKINEYKRRQAPVGPRVTQRGFGKDWRYPITNRFS